jgi:DNA-binding Lrp family transcriptional regulator
MKEIRLDAKDKKILAELDFNARKPVSQIAKKIRVSKEVALYRIKRLEKQGVIKDYHAVINNSKIGNYYSRLLIKFQNLDKFTENKIIIYLKENSKIGYYGKLDGNWDILIGYWAEDLFDFENFVSVLTYKFGKYILEKEIGFGLHVWQLPYRVLYDVNSIKQFETGGKTNKVKLDEKDKKLLVLLTKNSKLSLQELGSKAGLSWKTVYYRIKNLEKNKVIVGYRTNIDYRKLGYNNTKVLLHLQNLTKEKESELIAYLRSLKNCIWVIKYVGKSDLEFEALTQKREEFLESMKALREKFRNIIRNYEQFIIHEEPISRFIPLEN